MTAPLSLLAVVACGGGAPAASPPPTPPPPPVVAAPPPPSLTGIWLGTLHPGGKSLRLQLRLDQAASTCTIDSLDQHSAGIPCTASVAGTALSFEIPAVHGSFKGTASKDGNTVNGTFTQRDSLELVLTRQATALDPATIGFDAARPALDADLDKLKAVLDFDLTDALAKGELAPETGGGIAIGVVSHGVRKIFTYGTAKPDSVFEIGSITKTFTGLLLAQMVEQKKVHLDDPARSLIPKASAPPPSTGPEITLVDLSAQRSGLPPLPPNLTVEMVDPYANYDATKLYAAVQTQGLARPATPKFAYSNFGVGFLGQLLADRAGTSYEALLTKEITRPLGMKETVQTLTPALQARLLPGHDGAHKPAQPWSFKALAGAGAIRSTAADMLTYLEAQLHPDKLPKSALASAEGKTLPAAITASHVAQGEAEKGEHIALNWFRPDDGSYWHNGATGGYSSFAVFNADRDYAVVVLFNNTIGGRHFADELGQHVMQRLSGRPAVTLAP